MKRGDYEEFFSLTERPFDLVPNPEFLYPSRTHSKALTYLEYGIAEKAGFILLTGEVGSGKTTLIRDLIKRLDKKTVLSKVFNTRVNSVQLIAMINDDFGLEVGGKEKTVLLRELYDFLIERFANGYSPVLVIDEAQNLDFELLEEVRMLSNLETDSSKLLQIILVGQPELRKVLARPELRQFRQRINISCHLVNLTRDEAEEYILHRLEVAGNRAAVTFAPEALDTVFRYSRGVPRLINIICDFLMLAAFTEKTKTINGGMAEDIIRDLDFENRYWDFEKGGDGVEEPIELEEVVHDGVDDMLKEIYSRLEALERKALVTNIGLPKDLTRRIERLERCLEAAAISGPDTAGRLEGSIPVQDEHKAAKRGFIKRIFGQPGHEDK